MVQPPSEDGGAADPARAGQGAWSEPGQALYDAEEDVGLPCQCRVHDMEVADAAQPQPGARLCCCCARRGRCGTPGGLSQGTTGSDWCSA
uniref:Uncharacterized protein n=1 Tax=Sphaerodactylus townsendi TaxID=933632 RepID=A0ACB8F943_9SAUR